MSNQNTKTIMKAIKYTLLSLAALVFSACNLQEEPDSFVDHETFYENVMQCRAAVNSCYNSMKPIFTANYMMAVEGCTDLWYCTSSTVDAILDVSPAKPQMGKNVWQYGYQGVMRCNECIDCILNSKVEDEKKMPLVAEAVVLRAFYYYILTSFFGDVPYYTERVKDIATLEKVRRLPRMSAVETRQALYDDINEHMQYLPQQRTCEDKEARAGAALGYMLMAKFAMWNQQWDEALTPLLKLEELYGDLQQYPLHEIMWRYKNVPEGIFELQLNYAPDGVQYYGNVACIMMPPHQGKGVFNGVFLSEYGDTMTAWASLRANNYFGIFRPAYAKTPDAVQKKEQSGYEQAGLYNPLPLTYDDNAVDEDKNGINDNVFFTSGQYRYYVQLDKEAAKTGKFADGTPVDKRIQYKLGLGDVDSESTIGKDYTFEYVRQWGVPWPGPQFWCPGIISTYDGNNYRLFRYADAILMLAECYCEKGDDTESLKYLNMVKERAGIPAYENFSSFEELTIEIRNERGRELAGEFMRKYDLVRWGIWYEQTFTYTNYGKLKDNMKPCHRYYPIPDTQCGLSGGALTNDEYTANGIQ